ncbi:signal transduction histidine kinase/CheY-like chemotaxis protein [Brevundimonas vesicularis]|uniref:ATP-binding protein n=1 Tax=Brevundimonas vesicularis TaxID=41276 RepID=UPI00278AE649|nr:ATP-binding protein [Brevundimonas vesicularis]MDQ1191967.1 signal transduction histidine kinase/CheY-like chemotaxis protein [Brevundimonas vesicularis]
MKSTAVDIAESSWTAAVRQRSGAAVQRLVAAAAVALVVTPMVGVRFTFGWVVLYLAVQAMEMVVYRPILEAPGELSSGRKLAVLTVVAVSSTVFAALSLVMWKIGGAIGGVSAALMLSACMLTAMLNANRCQAVMIAGLAPQTGFLLATPVFVYALDASGPLVMSAAAAVVLFTFYVAITGQRMVEASANVVRAHALAEDSRLKAERSLADHTTFLAAIGHDLRTPIGAILAGAAELRSPDAQSRNSANLITDAGLMMKALLDDLLDHTRIGAGRMTVEAKDFDLRQMLAQTLMLWRGVADAKGLKLRIEGASAMPRHVKGDVMRIRQVLNNLLSNAMKFTEQGQITLRVQAWPEEPSGYALLFEIVDTGPGMTTDQLARLFTPFDQTAEGVSARYGGSGLGLAISRNLIDLMGGRLTVRSASGQGSRFTVSLILPRGDEAAQIVEVVDESRLDIARSLTPSVAPTPQPASVAPSPAPEPEPVAATPAVADEAEDQPLRLLVVDDHDINRRAVQLILQPLGCEITTAADGMIALERCQEAVFDVIFMDVRMPELDGRETTRRLRAGGGPNAATPVVAVTADTAPEDVAACQAAGMAYFVSKPLTPPALIGALQHVLNDTAAQAATEAA